MFTQKKSNRTTRIVAATLAIILMIGFAPLDIFAASMQGSSVSSSEVTSEVASDVVSKVTSESQEETPSSQAETPISQAESSPAKESLGVKKPASKADLSAVQAEVYELLVVLRASVAEADFSAITFALDGIALNKQEDGSFIVEAVTEGNHALTMNGCPEAFVPGAEWNKTEDGYSREILVSSTGQQVDVVLIEAASSLESTGFAGRITQKGNPRARVLINPGISDITISIGELDEQGVVVADTLASQVTGADGEYNFDTFVLDGAKQYRITLSLPEGRSISGQGWQKIEGTNNYFQDFTGASLQGASQGLEIITYTTGKYKLVFSYFDAGIGDYLTQANGKEPAFVTLKHYNENDEETHTLRNGYIDSGYFQEEQLTNEGYYIYTVTSGVKGSMMSSADDIMKADNEIFTFIGAEENNGIYTYCWKIDFAETDVDDNYMGEHTFIDTLANFVVNKEYKDVAPVEEPVWIGALRSDEANYNKVEWAQVEDGKVTFSELVTRGTVNLQRKDKNGAPAAGAGASVPVPSSNLYGYVLYEYAIGSVRPEGNDIWNYRKDIQNFTLPGSIDPQDYYLWESSGQYHSLAEKENETTITNVQMDPESNGVVFYTGMDGNYQLLARKGKITTWSMQKKASVDPAKALTTRGEEWDVDYTVTFNGTRSDDTKGQLIFKDIKMSFTYSILAARGNNKIAGDVILEKADGAGNYSTIDSKEIELFLKDGTDLSVKQKSLKAIVTLRDDEYSPGAKYRLRFDGGFWYSSDGEPTEETHHTETKIDVTINKEPTDTSGGEYTDDNIKAFADTIGEIEGAKISKISNLKINNANWTGGKVEIAPNEKSATISSKSQSTSLDFIENSQKTGKTVTVTYTVRYKDESYNKLAPCAETYTITNKAEAKTSTDNNIIDKTHTLIVKTPTYNGLVINKTKTALGQTTPMPEENIEFQLVDNGTVLGHGKTLANGRMIFVTDATGNQEFAAGKTYLNDAGGLQYGSFTSVDNIDGIVHLQAGKTYELRMIANNTDYPPYTGNAKWNFDVANNYYTTSYTMPADKTCGLATLEISNKPDTSLTITKTMVDDTIALTKTKFYLYQDNTLLASASPDSSKKVVFKNIEYGTYTLYEVTPKEAKPAGNWEETATFPSGIVVPSGSKVYVNTEAVVFDKIGTKDIAIEVVNLKQQDLVVTKIVGNSTEQNKGDFWFRVSKKGETAPLTFTKVSDTMYNYIAGGTGTEMNIKGNGTVTIKGLPAGEYTVTENTAKMGELVNGATQYTAVVSSADVVLDWSDSKDAVAARLENKLIDDSSFIISKKLDDAQSNAFDKAKWFTFKVLDENGVNPVNLTDITAGEQATETCEVPAQTGNDIGVFRLKAGGELAFINMTAGTKYTIVEQENGVYNTSHSVSGSANVQGATATLVAGKDATLTFTNARKDNGGISVQKANNATISDSEIFVIRVRGNFADNTTEKELRFQRGGATEFNEDVSTVYELGKNISLPKSLLLFGEEYTITETNIEGTDAAGNAVSLTNYMTNASNNGANISKIILGTNANTVVFTNVRIATKLTVQKIVDNYGPQEEKFTVTVTGVFASAANKAEQGEKILVFARNGTATAWSNAANTVYKTGAQITIPDTIAGYDYVVAEVDDLSDAYATPTIKAGTNVVDGYSITVPKLTGTPTAVSITNTRKASPVLTVMKKTEGHIGASETFVLEVTGTFADGATTKTLRFAPSGTAEEWNSAASTVYKTGTAITIPGTIWGQAYKVSETKIENGSLSNYNVTMNGQETKQHTISTLTQDEDVVVTNTRATNQALRIGKKVVGNIPAESVFTITVAGQFSDTSDQSKTFLFKKGAGAGTGTGEHELDTLVAVTGTIYGYDYTITEQNMDGYTVSFSDGANDLTATGAGEYAIANLTGQADVFVVNKHNSPQLTVTKDTALLAKSSDTFMLTIKGLFEEGEAEKTVQFAKGSTVTSTVYAANEVYQPGTSVVIPGTLYGETYTVTETAAATLLGNYTASFSPAGSGSDFARDYELVEKIDVVVTNTRKTTADATLQIGKKVVANNTNDSSGDSFEVSVSGMFDSGENGIVKNEIKTFVFAQNPAAGQYKTEELITVPGTVYGETYTVTEKAISGGKYVTSYEAESGALGTALTSETKIWVVNTVQYDSFTVEKKLSQDDKVTDRANKTFSFTLQDDKGNAVKLSADGSDGVKTVFTGGGEIADQNEHLGGFVLKEGAKATFENLPVGSLYVVKETNDALYTTEIVQVYGKTVVHDVVVEGQTTDNLAIGEINTVVFMNTIKSSPVLTVSKTVTGFESGYASDDVYQIRVTGPYLPTGATEVIPEYTTIVEFKAGEEVVSKALEYDKLYGIGSVVEIPGTVIGGTYQISETVNDEPISSYTMTVTGADKFENGVAALALKEAKNVVVQNSRKTATLQISKQVPAEQTTYDKELFYTFLVTKDGSPIAVSTDGANGTIKVSFDQNGNIAAGADNTGRIRLQSGATATLENLVAGSEYVVSEVSNTADSFDTNHFDTVVTGGITVQGGQKAIAGIDTALIFTNTRKISAGLALQKDIVGDAKNKMGEFDVFAITVSGRFVDGEKEMTLLFSQEATATEFDGENVDTVYATGSPIQIPGTVYGEKYKVVEDASNNNYTPQYKVNEEAYADGFSASITAGATEQKVSLLNTRKTSAGIAVQKDVDGYANNADGEADVFKMVVSGRFTDGEKEVELLFSQNGTKTVYEVGNPEAVYKTGVAIQISETVFGAEYTVKENAHSAYEAQYKVGTNAYASGRSTKVSAGAEEQTVYLLNTRKAGKLSVSKLLEDAFENDEAFTIEVKGLFLNEQSVYAEDVRTLVFTQTGQAITVYDEAIESYKLGTIVELPGVAYSTNYTILETSMQGGALTSYTATVQEQQNGNAEAEETLDSATGKQVLLGTDTEVTVKNTRNLGSLQVSKLRIDEDKFIAGGDLFEFQLMRGTNPVDITDLTLTSANSTVEIKDTATGTFVLGVGDTLTISGLPIGGEFTVVENAENNLYTTTVAVNGEDKGESQRGTAMVNADVVSEIHFTNQHKTASLVVEKAKGDSDAVILPSDSFTFAVQQGAEEVDLNQYTVTFNPALPEAKVNSDGAIEMPYGVQATIEGLRIAAEYTVTEVAASNAEDEECKLSHFDTANTTYTEDDIEIDTNDSTIATVKAGEAAKAVFTNTSKKAPELVVQHNLVDEFKSGKETFNIAVTGMFESAAGRVYETRIIPYTTAKEAAESASFENGETYGVGTNVTVSGTVYGYAYTVEESDIVWENQEGTQQANYTAAINAVATTSHTTETLKTESVKAEVVHTRKTGTVTLEKVVSDKNGALSNGTYYFTLAQKEGTNTTPLRVKWDDAAQAYTLSIKGDATEVEIPTKAFTGGREIQQVPYGITILVDENTQKMPATRYQLDSIEGNNLVLSDANPNHTVTAYNSRLAEIIPEPEVSTGSLTIVKNVVNENGAAATGSYTFIVTGAGYNKTVSVDVANYTGELTLKDLPFGSYTVAEVLSETAIADGYYLANSEGAEFTLDKNTILHSATFENAKKVGSEEKKPGSDTTPGSSPGGGSDATPNPTSGTRVTVVASTAGAGAVSANAAAGSTTATASVSEGTTGNGSAAEITSQDVPLAALKGEASWSIINLLIAIFGALSAAFLIAKAIQRKKKNSGAVSQKSSKGLGAMWSVFAIVTGIAAPIVFILVENLKAPMVVINNWTVLMAVLFAIEIMFVTLMKHANIQNSNEDEQQAQQ